MKNTPFRQDLMFHLDKVFSQHIPLCVLAPKGTATAVYIKVNYKY